jgi:hypothetical protein
MNILDEENMGKLRQSTPEAVQIFLGALFDCEGFLLGFVWLRKNKKAFLS